jgi:hypothetical protein
MKPFPAFRLLFPLIVSVLLIVQASAAKIVFVNQNAPPASTKSGTSWTNAYTDLAEALAAVTPTQQVPVEIWVAGGTYRPTKGDDRAASFRLKSHLTIRGGFSGNENSPGQRNRLAPPTVLSGDIGDRQANPIDHKTPLVGLLSEDFAPNPADEGFRDNCYTVVTAIEVTHVELDQVVVTGGYADGPRGYDVQITDGILPPGEGVGMVAIGRDSTDGSLRIRIFDAPGDPSTVEGVELKSTAAQDLAEEELADLSHENPGLIALIKQQLQRVAGGSGMVLNTGKPVDNSASVVTLATSASSTSNSYNGNYVSIESGTGAGQERSIVTYLGSPRLAFVNPPWNVVPNATSGYAVNAFPRGTVVPPLFTNLRTKGVARSGYGTNSLALASSASAADSAYKGKELHIVSGKGAGQIRTITSYVGQHQVAFLDSPWTEIPDTNSVYKVVDPKEAPELTHDQKWALLRALARLTGLPALLETGYGLDELEAMSTPLMGANLSRREKEKALNGESKERPDRHVAGGGIFAGNESMGQQPSLRLRNSIVRGNYAFGHGGGVAAVRYALSAENSLFTANLSGGEGGAVWLQNCLSSVTACSFAKNESIQLGGAIFHNTLPSRQTLLPGVSDSSVLKMTGMSRLDFQTYVSSSVFAAKASMAVGLGSPEVASAFRSGFKPKRDMSIDERANLEAQSYLFGEIAPTGALGKVVLVGDIATMYAELLGTSSNNVHIRRWRAFSQEFNKWTNPNTASLGLVEILCKGDLLPCGPDPKLMARQMRIWQKAAYNSAGVSSVTLSTFSDNTSASGGGAIATLHSNMHIEACTFDGNDAGVSGGALFQGGWNSVKVISSGFSRNVGTKGDSAITNTTHCNAFIVNCSLLDNRSSHKNHRAVGNFSGSEVQVSNSVLWGNTNPDKPAGGADILTMTRPMLRTLLTVEKDTDGLKRLDRQGPGYVDLVAWCEIDHSVVQSLGSLEEGTEEFVKFYGIGKGFGDSMIEINEKLNQRIAGFKRGDELGQLPAFNFLNVGEGNRPDFRKGRSNSADDPLLQGFNPLPRSRLIDRGNPLRLNNGYVNSMTNRDLNSDDRLQGEQLDIGAIEGDASIIIHVQPNGTGDGSSWNTATSDLAAALSTENAKVYVAAGIYRPTGGADRSASFEIASGVRAYGGFRPELGITELANRTSEARTIISGDIGIAGDHSDNSHVLIRPGAETGEAQLDMFEFINARGAPGQPGGAIVSSGFSLRIANCRFEDNHSDESGAALRADDASTRTEVENCVFLDNVSAKSGGAIWARGQLTVRRGEFRGNRAASGGAVRLDGGSARFSNSLFARNTALAATDMAGGGAIEAVNADVTFVNCTVADNRVLGAAVAAGGGLRFFSSEDARFLAVENSIFWGNRARGGTLTDESLTLQQIQVEQYVFETTLALGNNFVEGGGRRLDSPLSPGSLPTELPATNYAIDPEFVDALSDNYRLLSLSRGIDFGIYHFDSQGVELTEAKDLDGRQRRVNQHPDLGAYEFQGLPLNPSTDIEVARECGGAGPRIRLSYVGVLSAGQSFGWEIDRNDGEGWKVVGTDAIHSGWNTPVLTLLNPGMERNGFRYRVAVNNGGFISKAAPVEIFLDASRYYVKADATGYGTGRDWANAFTTLGEAQEAVEKARSPGSRCVEIWVAAGTYSPTATGNRDDSIHLRSGVALYGGFAGHETVREARNWRVNRTVISGELGDPASAKDNSYAVVDSSSAWGSADSSAVLDGFVITGASGNSLEIRDSSPTIRNCEFSGNLGSSAVSTSRSAPRFENCSFLDNQTIFGAVRSDHSQDVFVNSLFARNSTVGRGGAIHATGSNITLLHSTVADNRAGYDCGGVYLHMAGTLSISGSILWGNRAEITSPEDGFGEQCFDREGSSVLSIVSSILEGFGVSDNKGNVPFDPLFTNAIAGDYRLSSISPAVNAVSGMPFLGGEDLDGEPRLAGPALDMGAFEFQGSPAATPARLLQSPQPVTTCAGAGPASFSAKGLSTSGYVWQADFGAGFVDLPNSGNYIIVGSEAGSLLTVVNPTLDLSGVKFRAVLTQANFATPAVPLVVFPPSVIHVNAAASGADDGSSWENAFTSLEAAIAVADSCSEIWVAEGTYPSAGDAMRLIPYLKIFGGFTGQESSRAERNWSNHKTILMGAPGESVFRGRGQTLAIGPSTIIDGFVFRSSGVSPAIDLANHASPTIRNCMFEGPGPALFTRSCAPVVVDCSFIDSTVTPVNNSRSTPSFVRCVFTGNSSDSIGGAMLNEAAAPGIDDCRFEANRAGSGAAIANVSGSSPIITRSKFIANHSRSGGALDHSGSGSVELSNCLFAENESAHLGAAITLNGGELQLTHVTIVNNRATRFGGAGLYVHAGEAVAVNSIFWGNVSRDAAPSAGREAQQIHIDPKGALAIRWSCVEGLDGFAHESNTRFNPLLIDLGGGDYRLNVNSPAVDAGSNAAAARLTTDLDGAPRRFNASVDLGAYELQTPASAPLRLVAHPTDTDGCVGGSATFSVRLSAQQAAQVVWQVRVGAGFVDLIEGGQVQFNLSGEVKSLDLLGLAASMNGKEYRYRIPALNYVSEAVRLTVYLPGVVHVKANAAPGGDGASWATAFTHLQDALAVAGSCAEVWVAEGDYAMKPTAVGEFHYALKPGLEIYGGFAGVEEQREERDPARFVSRLIGHPGAEAVVVARGTRDGRTAPVLDGFAIEAPDSHGILIVGASPTLRNLVIKARRGEGSGDGVAGVGIFNDAASSPSIISCRFIGNESGGIVNRGGSSPAIDGCSFEGNENAVGGGAIYNSFGSNPMISNCHFQGNRAPFGGAIFSQQSSPKVRTSRFVENVSLSDGGAIATFSGSIVIEQALMVNNRAGRGGAISHAGGTLRLVNATLYGNRATGEAGGIYLLRESTGSELLNTILWNNASGHAPAAAEASQIVSAGGFDGITVENSCVQGLSSISGPGNLAADPFFTEPDSGNFELLSYSPAINTGENSFLTASMTLDLAGRSRKVGGTVDMGAFEALEAEDPVVIYTLPTATSTCMGSFASFTVAGARPGNFYVWQVMRGDAFEDVSGPDYQVEVGENASKLTVRNAGEASGEWFRVRLLYSDFTSPPVAFQVTLPDVWYVDGSATGSGSGTSWADAFTSLNQALAAVPGCAEIWVAKGVYTSSATLSLRPNVAIFGGFNGTETARAQRDLAVNETVLTTSPSVDLMINEAIFGIDRTAVLDGVIIREAGNGFAAVYNRGASPVFRNVSFEGNLRTAVVNYLDSEPLFIHCTFRNNPAGAVENWRSSALFEGCVFTGNGTHDSSVGAVTNFSSAVTFRNTTFHRNAAVGGGAVNSTFGSSATFERCRFEENSARDVGGAVAARDSTINITNSLLVLNRSRSDGGAVAFSNSTLEMVHCTVARNRSARGAAGVHGRSSELAVTNSIVWGNRLLGAAGTLEDSQVVAELGEVSIVSSIVEGLSAFEGNDNLKTDPLFAAPDAGDFRLMRFSPAVDYGVEATVGAVDLAGQPRLFGEGPDLGAYELQEASAVPVLLASLPQSQSVCEGGTAIFKLVLLGEAPEMPLWDRFAENGWVNLVQGAPYEVLDDGSLVVTDVTAGQDGSIFRFRIPGTGFVSPELNLQVSAPSVIHVDGRVAVAGDGSSWTTAVKTLSEAIEWWTPCSEIWMAAGTYELEATVSLRSGMRIYGGFSGDETSRDQQDFSVHETRLMPRSNRPLFLNQGSLYEIRRSSVLDGLVFSGTLGQAIINGRASPTIRHCRFEDNASAVFNGANSEPLFEHCTFSGQRGFFEGAVYSVNSSPTFVGCVFTDNQSRSGGAAIFSYGGTTTVDGCRFEGNRSERLGGAIRVELNAVLAVSRSSFIGNHAADWGGAISVVNASGSISDSLFALNRSNNRGGALGLEGGRILIERCTVVDNIARTGGGIQVGGPGLIVSESILWGNRQTLAQTGREPAQVTFSPGTAPVIGRSLIDGLASLSGNGNIAFDPLFIDAEAGDFRLSRFSPAIDGGAELAAGSSDLDGLPRVVGGRVDMGAYEFQADLVIPTPLRVLQGPESVTACSGDSVFITVSGEAGDGVSYLWQVNEGSGWAVVPLGNGVYSVESGAGFSTLRIDPVARAMNGWLYRFIATGGDLQEPYESDPAELTVSLPGVIFVKADAAGSNSGADWQNAFTSLGPALQAATRCSEIWVAQGIYSLPPTGPLAMKDGVEIYGGFSGIEQTREERDWASQPTLLSASGFSSFFANNGLFAPISQSATLDGFIFTSAGSSSGMVNTQASPTVRNCRFANHGNVAVSNTIGSHPLFENCVFAGNAFGAIDARSRSTITLSGCEFTGNKSSGTGGAIRLRDATAVIEQCVFAGNQALYGGGAVALGEGASVVARRCIFDGNLTFNEGAAILAEPGATGLEVSNSLFTGGSAFGGGAVSSYAPATLINCTITANTAYSRGSAFHAGGSSLSVLNSVVWGNSDTLSAGGDRELAQLQSSGTTVFVSHSILEGLSVHGGNNNSPYDPLFIAPSAGNFRPQENFSPAVNAGANAFIGGAPTDLDGKPRLLFGVVDIGAYESLTADSSFVVGILRQPAPVTVCGSSPASFTVEGRTGYGPAFTWQMKAPDGSFGPVQPGARFTISSTDTASTLTVSADFDLDGYSFRARYEPGAGIYYSEAADLTVRAPSVIFVRADAPDDGDGTSWATAFPSLQSALEATDRCRPEIWVAAGTYQPSAADDATATFSIPPGVRIYGGFAGTETSLQQRDWVAHEVVLSGSRSSGDDCHRVVTFDGLETPIGASTVLDGFLVEKGSEAGILVFQASPTIRHCLSRHHRGPGLSVVGGGPRIERCSFLNNAAAAGGGVSLMDAANVVLLDVIISGNTAASHGGGMLAANSSFSMVNCQVSGNTAATGGGIYSSSGTGSLVNGTIVANASSGAAGAGLNSLGTAWTLGNGIFWGNRAGGIGGESAQLSFTGGTRLVRHSAIDGLAVLTGNSNQGHYPLFIAPVEASAAPTTLGDFSLQPCSPAIDAGDGNLTLALPADLAGNRRSVNLDVDLGAYEFQGSAASKLAITSQPSDVLACGAGSTSFEVGLWLQHLNNASFQWQISMDGGLTFVDLDDGGIFAGSHASRLDVNGTVVDGAAFRVRVRTAEGCELLSRAATLSQVAVQYVRADAPPGGDGLTWDTAFNNLRMAIFQACSSELWVAAGTYSSGSESFPLRDGLAIYGGFAGNETSPAQRDLWAHPTYLIGSGYYGVDGTGQDESAFSSARLDGFVIQGRDRGLYLNGFSPVIANCVFRNMRFAAVTVGEATPTFVDCVFDNNNTSQSTFVGGGAIDSYDASVTLVRCILRGNRSYGSGGAVTAGSLVAINSSFSGNFSKYGTGAISVGGPLELTHCTVSGNRSESGLGGVQAGGPVRVSNSIIWRNSGYMGETFDDQIGAGEGVEIVSSIVQGFHPEWHDWVDGTALDMDPLFHDPVNPASAPTLAGDFWLMPCSPAVDGGLADVDDGLLDLAGAPRVAGAAPDMGAYELSGSDSVIAGQPLSQMAVAGQTVQFSVVAAAATSFRWELRIGNEFVPLSDDALYSGTATSALTLTGVTLGMNGMEYRCRVESPLCVVYSRVATLAFLPLPPAAVTLSAGSVMSGAALLNGFINPNGFATSWYFEYGTTTSFGSVTPGSSPLMGDADAVVSYSLAGLLPQTTYHYRLVANSAGGTTVGASFSFTTQAVPVPPTVVTLEPDGVKRSSATLKGTVNPNGLATSWRFQYGASGSYGSFTPEFDLPAGGGAVAVSFQVTDLQPDQIYHYRLVAVSQDGQSAGNDISFTTPEKVPPGMTTFEVERVTSGSAMLRGSVNPNGLATQVLFIYGVPPNMFWATPDVDLPPGDEEVQVSYLVKGLQPDQAYHYRLVVTSEFGEAYANIVNFTTGPRVPPVAVTLEPEEVTTGSAVLKGTVDTKELWTSWYFEYGTSPESYDYSTSGAYLAPDPGVLAVSFPLTDLPAGQTYYYRLVATSDGGQSVGEEVAFTTLPLPTAVTLEPEAVKPDSAVLMGAVNTHGYATLWRFEYGTSSDYGSFTSIASLAPDAGEVVVSFPLVDLQPEQVYHYRLVATYEGGETVGEDVSFITPRAPFPPTVATLRPKALTPESAVLTATVSPNGYATSWYFEYGSTASYGSTSPSHPLAPDAGEVLVSFPLTDLATGQSYHYRVVAVYEGGEIAGGDVSFVVPGTVDYDFNDGLQGWEQIHPREGTLWDNGALGYYHDGWNEGTDDFTTFGRSPVFYLVGPGPLTFQLAGGESPLAAPHVGPSEIPEAAIAFGGFAGVALRDVEADAYVLSRRRTGNGGEWQDNQFSPEELAPFTNNGKRYTLDYIDYNRGSWGWTYLDNVSVPGVLVRSEPEARMTSIQIAPDNRVEFQGNQIKIVVPYGTDLSSIVPAISISPGARISPAIGTSLNFNHPVVFTVTSSDGLSVREFTVTTRIGGMLTVKTYQNIFGEGLLAPISNLLAETPSGSGNHFGNILYGDNRYPGFAGSLPGLTRDEEFSVVWEGWLDVTKEGLGFYTFGTHSDDGSVIYLDLDGNGSFDDPGELIVDNNGYHGMDIRTGTVDLQMDSVRIVIGFFEAGGGEGMEARFAKGADQPFESLVPIGGLSGHFLPEEPGGKQSPFDSWMRANFPSISGELAALGADADQDGHSNLEEFAFNTDPSDPSSGPLVIAAGVITSYGQPFLDRASRALIFGQRTDRISSGLVYTVLLSSDLNHWVTHDGPASVLAADERVQAVRVPFPSTIDTPGGPEVPQFARIRISLAD